MSAFTRLQKIILVLALAAPWGARAEAVPAPLKLDWVLAQLRRNNPAIKAARAEAGAAAAMAGAAGAWPDPQVGLEFWDLPRPGFDLNAAGQRWLDISQEIPFPGKTYWQSQVASHGAHLKAAQAETAWQDQAFEAKRAYWDLYAACESLKAVSRTARALDRLVRISRRRGRFGHAGRMEQLMEPMAGMEQADLENRALGLAQERLAARAALKRLMGLEGALDLPDPGGGTPDAAIDAAPLFKRAMERGPGIVEAKHHLLHLRAQGSLAAAQWMPDLMLQYSLGEDASGAPSALAMAKLNLPFLWFWRQRAEAAAARGEAAAAEAMLRAAYHEAVEALEAELGMQRTLRAQLENARERSLPQAELALGLGLSGYEAGSLGTADALGALKAYLAANLEAAGLRAQLGRSLAGLERMAGGSLDVTSSEMNHENE
jgi:cobalt-zinc-cadmium efflux system outer membrane protein